MFTMKYLENFVVILIMLKIGVLHFQLSLASPTTLPPDLTTTPFDQAQENESSYTSTPSTFTSNSSTPTSSTSTSTPSTSTSSPSVEDKLSELPQPSPASTTSGSSLLERVNIDQYLRNKRAMNLQIKCVVYGGTCDLVGKEVKKYIIIGLTGKCTNCSQKMTATVEKVVSYIQENYPQAWNDAIYKYLVEPVFSDKYRSPNATTPKSDETDS